MEDNNIGKIKKVGRVKGALIGAATTVGAILGKDHSDQSLPEVKTYQLPPEEDKAQSK